MRNLVIDFCATSFAKSPLNAVYISADGDGTGDPNPHCAISGVIKIRYLVRGTGVH